MVGTSKLVVVHYILYLRLQTYTLVCSLLPRHFHLKKVTVVYTGRTVEQLHPMTQLKLYVRYKVHSIESSLMMITVSVDMV